MLDSAGTQLHNKPLVSFSPTANLALSIIKHVVLIQLMQLANPSSLVQANDLQLGLRGVVAHCWLRTLEMEIRISQYIIHRHKKLSYALYCNKQSKL